MKLRNKKTGEVVKVEFISNWQSDDGTELEIGLIEPNSNNIYSYKSLDKLNAEWEDYEEPKECWAIDSIGGVFDINEEAMPQSVYSAKEIGNYFETKEEAEKAVEKLKAWKRLKDKGFRFEYYDYSDRDLHNHIQIKAITNREVEDSMLYKEDLDLLFGGEE